MGVPKMPTAIRKLHGTDKRNKHREVPNQVEVVNGIGEAPDHLSEDGKKIWDEIVGLMFQGVLGETDRLALEIMCNLVYRFRFSQVDEDVSGLTGAELSRLTGLLSEFGMTPSARTKISVPKQKPKNSFETI